MGRMALLPEELAGAQEGSRLLCLPSDHRVPLIQPEGEIAVTSDPLRVVWVHDGLGGRADLRGTRVSIRIPIRQGGSWASMNSYGNWDLEVLVSRLGYPS